MDKTAEHYADQWNPARGFREFITNNPGAAALMPARQLGWADLFERIRRDASERPVRVYDAGCGTALIMSELLARPVPSGLSYLGADVNPAVLEVQPLPGAKLMQWDMAEVLPEEALFDYVICRAAIHHTPAPDRSLGALVSQLAPGGTLAISVYAKKSPMREAVDDTLRAAIVPMPNEEAWKAVHQLTALGRDLQACEGRIRISEDLPLLGIRAGEYPVQSFIYEHFIKCWYNSLFEDRFSDLVNFDWYHPPHAFRFGADEFARMLTGKGLVVTKSMSIPAQHYFEACKPA
jgi:SAM-dependent methyltransferase